MKLLLPRKGALLIGFYHFIIICSLMGFVSVLRSSLVDTEIIHRFDCTEEHMGGAGQAGPWLDTANANVRTPS